MKYSRHASLRCSTCILCPANFVVQLWSLSDRCGVDTILQVGSWLTVDPEREYYSIALCLRALHVNAKGSIFCKLGLGSRLHRIIAAGRRRVAALAHRQGRHGALSLDNVQIYLQNFVLILYGMLCPQFHRVTQGAPCTTHGQSLHFYRPSFL